MSGTRIRVHANLDRTVFLPTDDHPLVSSLLSLKGGLGIREEDVKNDVRGIGLRRSFE